MQDGKPWTLGGYVQEIGVSARCKKTFGIYIPLDVEEEESLVSFKIYVNFSSSLVMTIYVQVNEKTGDNSGKRKADECPVRHLKQVLINGCMHIYAM